MPETSRSASTWRCRSAATILLLAAVSMQQALAQDSDTKEVAGASQTASTNTISAGTQAESANKGTLNFVDADIESVIAAVGDYTNTTFIIDPRVKGTLTLVSEKPLTKAQAFQLLGSVIALARLHDSHRQRL